MLKVFVTQWPCLNLTSIATSMGSKTICCRLITMMRVFTYGKWLAVVRIVFRLHCSWSSPCAFPFFVKGVAYINRSEWF